MEATSKSMSLLLIFGPKCTLAASDAVPDESCDYADETDTDGLQTVSLRFLRET